MVDAWHSAQNGCDVSRIEKREMFPNVASGQPPRLY